MTLQLPTVKHISPPPESIETHKRLRLPPNSEQENETNSDAGEEEEEEEEGEEDEKEGHAGSSASPDYHASDLDTDGEEEDGEEEEKKKEEEEAEEEEDGSRVVGHCRIEPLPMLPDRVKALSCCTFPLDPATPAVESTVIVAACSNGSITAWVLNITPSLSSPPTPSPSKFQTAVSHVSLLIIMLELL